MQKPLMRIPYTGPLPPPNILPRNANTITGAIAALSRFLTAPTSRSLQHGGGDPQSTVILSGAGISVASGLADYRGANGTYRVNRNYRPIYYHEFLANHEARKRYWARSFLGWSNLHKAKPNAGHYAIKSLGDMGIIRSVITQNVDSFHSIAHPDIPTLELHGYLRALTCVTCHNDLPREAFQESLARLNPAWAAFLAEAIASGALDTENPEERRAKGMKTNPDGDVDLPGAPYSTFRYPACPHCLANPPISGDDTQTKVEVDEEGAWKSSSTAGILKPAVVMFGESIASRMKDSAEEAIDGSGRLLVLGTSLATYSAWRLARRARERGMPIGILNLGGVRGEEAFFQDLPMGQHGEAGVRVELRTDKVLPGLVDQLKRIGFSHQKGDNSNQAEDDRTNSRAFKDMLS
ncbi:DHS-like NAD/FAD-binding domain-containing protein [Amylocarpus encephaloides]|uniref:DHS-like NAD/FAD-binding domain-containing protein n=1 Tax=Amylocarpus encephaloides TaxID=45428 RepID=A0A9P7YJQ9_9HELO|nr:DHS-like NAD/FAD-binding domain-containing protein [Amylocarpus encephaloides]